MKIKLLNILVIVAIVSCKTEKLEISEDASAISFKELSQNFQSPAIEYRPETWFHLMGNNISKEGLTLDLEAIKERVYKEYISLINRVGLTQM